MNNQQLKKLHEMRQLNEKLQISEKQLKALEIQIKDLSRKVPGRQGKSKLSEDIEYLKAINKVNKEDIMNYKNQIKELESKAKSNEQIISKLKSENEQLKRGRNNHAQNNHINNSINNIRDLSQSLGINLMEICDDDEIGNNINEQKIIDEKIGTLVKDNDTLRKLGIDRVDIGKGALTRSLAYVIDSVNEVEAIRRIEQKAAFFKKDGLKDEDIATMYQVQSILSSDADDTLKAQARITEAQIEAKYATTKAEREEAEYKIKNNQLLVALADEKAALELEKLKLTNKLSEQQINQIIEQVKNLQISNKYLPSEKVIGQVAKSVGVGTDVVNSIANIFKLIK